MNHLKKNQYKANINSFAENARSFDDYVAYFDVKNWRSYLENESNLPGK